MRYEFKDGGITVSRDGGKKLYSESVFLYHLKQALQRDGYDVIKKLMPKDGHLVADTQHYIVSHNRNHGFAIWDSAYAIRFTYEPYNQDGEVTLAVERY